MKTSVELPDKMVKRIKDYNITHKGRPINVSGVLQESLEKLLDELDPEYDTKSLHDPHAPAQGGEGSGGAESS